MATTVGDLPYTFSTSASTEAVLTLNPDRIYEVFHSGLTSAGAAATGTVILAADPDVAMTLADGVGKIALTHPGSRIVGPGVQSLRVKSLSGAPVVSVVPGPRLLGDW